MSGVETFAPALTDIIGAGADAGPDSGAGLAQLGDGFVAAEGPVWLADQQCLLFSDYRASKRYRWTEQEGVALLANDTNEGNGQTLDQQGRLCVCERATQRVVRYAAGGAVEVVADQWGGVRMNAPNDVIVSSGGTVIFTDPISPDYASERGYPGVFQVALAARQPTLLTRDIQFPNGLALSPDESVLYVNDTKRQAMYTVAAGPGGLVPDTEPRLFFQFDGAKGPGVADGLKVDAHGNIYSTGPGGVWIIDPAGQLLGIISTGPGHHTNLAWGGRDWRTLFITTRSSLWRMTLNIPGLPVPARCTAT